MGIQGFPFAANPAPFANLQATEKIQQSVCAARRNCAAPWRAYGRRNVQAGDIGNRQREAAKRAMMDLRDQFVGSLSVRAKAGLRAHRISSFEALIVLSAEEVFKWPNLRRNALRNIEAALEACGQFLRVPSAALEIKQKRKAAAELRDRIKKFNSVAALRIWSGLSLS